MKTRIMLVTAACFMFLMYTGCATSAAPTANAQVFLADDMNAGYDHVWVIINSISFVKADATSTTVFDATATGGRTIDLSRLHDLTGARFELLDGILALSGTYTGVTVNVASDLTVFTSGATTGTAATFAGSTAGGSFDLSLTFPAAVSVDADSDQVIDFDLANWTLDSSTDIVSATDGAFLKVSSSEGIEDHHRHVSSDHRGTLTGLAGFAPTQTFTISHDDNSLNVVLSASTVIANSDGSADPVLAEGQKVEVIGTYDTTNNVFNATSVIIIIGAEDADRVRGTVTAFDAIAGTVTIKTEDCEGFEPAHNKILISMADGVVYLDGGITASASDFFADLVIGSTTVVAHGSKTSTGFTASRIRIARDDDAHETIDLVVRGALSNFDSVAGTFDLTITAFEGFPVANGAVVHVVTTLSTEFRDAGGASTATSFFTSAPALARVKGTLDIATMTITAVKVGTGSDAAINP